MYLALIAIFGVFGSWAVWKRNPLFSAGKTWRIVGGMGLGIAAFVALDILLVNLTIHSSPWVAGGSLGLLIIVSVMGMYLISRAFTKPREQPLPVGIPLVTVHRQKVWLWTRRGGIFIAGLGLLGLVLPYGFNIAVWTIAGFTLFMALFLVPIGYMTARDRDRALTGVETMPWVHWQFSDEQWKAITALEVDRARAAATGTFDWKKQWKTMAVSLVLMVLLARAETSSWTVSLAICGGSVAFIAAIIWLSRMDAKKRARPQRASHGQGCTRRVFCRRRPVLGRGLLHLARIGSLLGRSFDR